MAVGQGVVCFLYSVECFVVFGFGVLGFWLCVSVCFWVLFWLPVVFCYGCLVYVYGVEISVVVLVLLGGLGVWCLEYFEGC